MRVNMSVSQPNCTIAAIAREVKPGWKHTEFSADTLLKIGLADWQSLLYRDC